MSARSDGVTGKRNAWLFSALLCAAMLVLPAIAWIAFPRPGGFQAPPAESDEAVAVASAIPAATASPRPRTERRPAPAATAAPAGTSASGVVLDPDGRPLAGAHVSCDGAGDATTGDDGTFTLADPCLAIARHNDFIASERVQLVAGKSNTLRLNRGGAIDGEVVDERNAPVTKYLLAVEAFQPPTGIADGSVGQGTRTINHPQGAFRLESLAAGRYVLTASADGRPPARSSPIDVELGRITYHVRITLPRGATLSGRILDADTKKPVPGAVIAFDGLTLTGANSTRPTRSDEAGAYTLEGAPPGPFSIRVSADGYNTKTVPGLVTRGAPTLRQDVELRVRGASGPMDEFAGIGAILGMIPDGVMVATLIPGGPAEKAGVQVGDLVTRIDGVDATGFPVTDCVQRLRGPEGSIVRMGLKRAGKAVEVMVTRRVFVR